MQTREKIREILVWDKGFKTGSEIRSLMFGHHQIALTPLEIRNCIRKMRKDGDLIIANSSGYKLCDLYNPADVEMLKKYLESRLVELADETITIHTMKSKLTNHENKERIKTQMCLFGTEEKC